jgi:hypothetical protein
LNNSPFDRLYGAKRNRKIRNFALSASGVSGLLAMILVLDPFLSGEPLSALTFLFFSFLFFVSIGLSLYFHLKFIARD